MKRCVTIFILAAMIFTCAVGVMGCCDTQTEDIHIDESYADDIYTNGITQVQPIELTIFMHMGAWGEMNPDWVIYGRDGGAAAMTNVDLRGVSVVTSGGSSLMTIPSPLPDIIQGNKTNLNRAGVEDESMMLPLNDLITDEYAPNIKRFFKENPEAWAGSVAEDGNLYFIPHMYEGTPSRGFFIRKDWLDKLDLEIPTTLDEYYAVLKAFREQDPNGNGKKDEVPYFDRDGGIDGLIQLWGLTTNNWGIDENGNVYFGKVTPEYKVAITEIAKWHAEGLIDHEIFTRGQKSRDLLFGDNRGGATVDWFSSTSRYNSLASGIDGFELIAIAPPADINGNVKIVFSRQQFSGQGWGISKDNVHPVRTMQYLDFWFSERGQRLYSYGIEGVDYNMLDGVPTFTEFVLDHPDSAPVYLRFRGQHEIGALMPADAEIATMHEKGAEGYRMYMDNGYIVPGFPKLSYTAEEEKILSSKSDVIFSYIREWDQRWFLGQADVDETWDDYLSVLDSLGLDEIREVHQAAYDRHLSKLEAVRRW